MKLWRRQTRTYLVGWTLILVSAASTSTAVRIRKRHYPPDLAEIVSRMTDAGKRLKTLSANLEYTKVTVLVNDKSVERGGLYFHESKSRQILIKIEKPDPKVILLKKNKAEIYNPKINQIQEYNLGQHTELVQQFFLLGFGKGTEDLKKRYNLTFITEESLDSDTAVVLQLIPRNESDAAHISKVLLWISEDSWLPVQQKFFEPSGDYAIARYTGVKVNRQLPSSLFQIQGAEGAKRVKMNP